MFYWNAKHPYLCMMSNRGTQRLKAFTARVVVGAYVLVYLLFSVGVLKATHFCMGREASVALFTRESEKCPCSLFAKDSDTCCDDRHELVRIDDDQKVISPFTVAPPHRELLEVFGFDEQVLHTAQFSGYAADDSPPLLPEPRWKMYCSFVFYDDGQSAA